jgi:hypothetical protein
MSIETTPFIVTLQEVLLAKLRNVESIKKGLKSEPLVVTLGKVVLKDDPEKGQLMQHVFNSTSGKYIYIAGTFGGEAEPMPKLCGVYETETGILVNEEYTFTTPKDGEPFTRTDATDEIIRKDAFKLVYEDFVGTQRATTDLTADEVAEMMLPEAVKATIIKHINHGVIYRLDENDLPRMLQLSTNKAKAKEIK